MIIKLICIWYIHINNINYRILTFYLIFRVVNFMKFTIKLDFRVLDFFLFSRYENFTTRKSIFAFSRFLGVNFTLVSSAMLIH
jgi:hypothetical protein